MTVSLDIRDAVIEALNAALPAGIPVASKRRVMPGEPVTEPFIAVFLGQEPVSYPGGSRAPIAQRELEVMIELGIVTDDITQIDDLIEPMRAHLVDRLGDTNLSGLATAVNERGIPEGGRLVYKLDLYNALTFVRFDVRYQTKRDDLGAKQ